MARAFIRGIVIVEDFNNDMLIGGQGVAVLHLRAAIAGFLRVAKAITTSAPKCAVPFKVIIKYNDVSLKLTAESPQSHNIGEVSVTLELDNLQASIADAQSTLKDVVEAHTLLLQTHDLLMAALRARGELEVGHKDENTRCDLMDGTEEWWNMSRRGISGDSILSTIVLHSSATLAIIC